MKTIKLSKGEELLLKTFSKCKKCPTNEELGKKVGMSTEYVRVLMWKLVSKKLVNVNKKLKSKKFYVKQ